MRSVKATTDIAFFAAAVAITRFLFRSHYLYDIDSINFALALRHFNPAIYQPHPPGYFLYIYLGRLSNMLIADANSALVAVSIAASAAAVAGIYLLTNEWFGRAAARCAGLIFLFSPLAWFHGTVALTYIVEAAFSSVIGYFSWRLCEGNRPAAIAGAFALGLAIGFRPSSVLFLGPLFLFSMRRLPRKYVLLSGAVLAATLLAWLVPMIGQSGGITAYWTSLASLWHIAGGKQTVVNSNPLTSVARALTIVAISALCFGCACLFAFIKRPLQQINRSVVLFSWVWITPGLIFFTFVFLRFVNSGYLLVLSPPAFAWLGYRMASWLTPPRSPGAASASLLAAGAVINTLLFLYAPLYCSWNSIRRTGMELSRAVSAVDRLASDRTTLIIGFDSHFLGYRHAGYYLPRFEVVQYPPVHLGSEAKIFTMKDRETRVVDSLPQTSFTHFILFPLPSRDSEYTTYIEQVKAHFSRGQLQEIRAAGQQLFVGRIADLGRLFPAVRNAVALQASSISGQESACNLATTRTGACKRP